MDDSSEIVSRSAATKAGKKLRDFVRDGGSVAELRRCGSPLSKEYGTLSKFREGFRPQTTATNIDVRQVATRLKIEDCQVAQRTKRAERIIYKLARPDSSDLGRLEDIGGVRAIVPDLANQQLLTSALNSQLSVRVEYLSSREASNER